MDRSILEGWLVARSLLAHLLVQVELEGSEVVPPADDAGFQVLVRLVLLVSLQDEGNP